MHSTVIHSACELVAATVPASRKQGVKASGVVCNATKSSTRVASAKLNARSSAFTKTAFTAQRQSRIAATERVFSVQAADDKKEDKKEEKKSGDKKEKTWKRGYAHLCGSHP
eukprot:337727-Prorocentrum_minimum.AAC.2